MRIAMRVTTAALALACVAVTAGCGSASAAPDAQRLAGELAANDAAVRAAIDDWHARAGDPPAGQAPDEVLGPARFLQERVRVLARNEKLAGQTAALLDDPLARQVRDLTAAARGLGTLGAGDDRVLKEGKPRPLAELIRYYEQADRRYGIDWNVLAAINLVETKFGRVKADSVAGAKGPMQFIPSTWRIYGRGGNIKDPRDAILAAARLLRANGAPGHYAAALHHYNDSDLYVAAVLRYSRLIARDPYAVRVLYCWGP